MNIGGTDPCPCGCGRKYKNCCLPGRPRAVSARNGSAAACPGCTGSLPVRGDPPVFGRERKSGASAGHALPGGEGDTADAVAVPERIFRGDPPGVLRGASGRHRARRVGAVAGLLPERRGAAIGRRSWKGRTDQPSFVRMAVGNRRYFIQDAGAPPGASFRESVSDGQDGGPGNGDGVHDGATRHGETGIPVDRFRGERRETGSRVLRQGADGNPGRTCKACSMHLMEAKMPGSPH